MIVIIIIAYCNFSEKTCLRHFVFCSFSLLEVVAVPLILAVPRPSLATMTEQELSSRGPCRDPPGG